MRYRSNKTNVWQEILTRSTLAFSCEVVHEKLSKSVYICKSYSERISGTFLCGDSVDDHNVVIADTLAAQVRLRHYCHRNK